MTKVFKTTYFKLAELKWREAGAFWSPANERVEEYVTRLRWAANRLEFSSEVLLYAVVNGLRGR
jgi:hypothetical protein